MANGFRPILRVVRISCGRPPHRGRRNEPAYTALTAAVGATLYGLSYEDFAAQTEANFDRLFTRARRAAKAA